MSSASGSGDDDIYVPLIVIAMAAFAVLCVFSSCSKNDDGKGGSASIIGTWRVVSEEGYEIYYGEKDEWNEVYSEDYYYTLTFNKSGRGYTAERYDGLIKDEDNFTWKLSGNKLTIHFEGESEGETGKIEMLTAKTLVLSYEWVDGDDRGYSKITCTFVGRE